MARCIVRAVIGECYRFASIVKLMPKTRNHYPISSQLLGYLLSVSNYRLSERANQMFKPYKLNVPAWCVLNTLYEHDGQSVSQLKAVTMLRQPTLTKILDRLEAERYVKRRFNRNDKRVTLVSITKKGKEAIARLLKKEVPRLESLAFANSSKREQIQLKALLHKVIDDLGKAYD